MYEEKAKLTLEERMHENAIKQEKGEKFIVVHTDVMYAELKGGFGDYITHLRNKLCKLAQADTAIVKDDLIVINSFDGAIHGETGKKQCLITLSSSAVITKELVKMGISSASTKVIMMWKQVIGEEHLSTVIPATKGVYKWIDARTKDGDTIVDGKRMYIYEVSDDKMIYNLTNHSK